MSQTHFQRAAVMIALIFTSVFSYAQVQLPPGFEQQKKDEFKKIQSPEITFEQYLDFQKQEYFRLEDLNLKKTMRLNLSSNNTPCGNGDFESGLNASEWTGGYGSVLGNGNPDFANFTSGILQGAINLLTSRQTLVSAGTDPNVPINMVAPGGSTKAVRIGNSAVGKGSELLSKTFTVASANATIRFWYAAVFQNPNPTHGVISNPSFWVRVLDANGNEIAGTVDLGGASTSGSPAKIVSDKNNPFFKVKGNLVYRDWDCAEIDLSSQIGKKVTVQFVTEDCTQGAHYGYAYVDNFCSDACSGPTGGISFNPTGSSDCGKGKICFNYTLPQVGTTTGSVVVTLNIYQNGSTTPVTTLTSPTLTSGSSYCFSIDPGIISGLNTSAGYFDFAATGQFAFGSSNLPPKTVGSKPDGVKPSTNNDYKIACEQSGKFCCPSENLVKNGSFEAGNVDFNSQYAPQTSTAANAVLPGQYEVLSGNQASSICRNWAAQAHNTCTGNGNFLAVNGETTQSANTGNIIWQQTIAVQRDSQYRFCAHFKNLPACCFDVKPRIQIEITPGATSPWTTISASTLACDWQLVSLTFTASTNSVTVKIYLDELGRGDGNDMALDDISLIKTPKPKVNMFAGIQNGTSTAPTVTASYNGPGTGDDQLQAPCRFAWTVCKYDPLTNSLSGCMSNSAWGLTTNFPGYNFQYGQYYHIVLSVFRCGDCVGRAYNYAQVYHRGPSVRVGGPQMEVKTMQELNLSPEMELQLLQQSEQNINKGN